MKTHSIIYCYLVLFAMTLVVGNIEAKTSRFTVHSGFIETVQEIKTQINDGLEIVVPGNNAYDSNIDINITQLYSFYPWQSFAMREEFIRTDQQFKSYLKI